MEITFLGTSSGWPLPRLGCDCEICSSRDPKDKRTRPSLLINHSVLVDCGPDVYQQILNSKLKIENLKALIITHAHSDHLLGFYDITHLYHHQPEINLYLTQETLVGLKQSYKYPLKPFWPQVIRPLEAFTLDQATYAFIPVEHNHFPTWGLKMKERRLVGYFPDIKNLPKSQEKTCRDLYLLILDGSSLGTLGQTSTHENIIEGVALAKKLRAKHVYFTHLGHKTGRHKELEKFVQKEGGRNFHIAYDNLVLTI